MAKVAKGEKREYETAVVLWIDLLGYGSMLEAAAWNPTASTAKSSDRTDRDVSGDRNAPLHEAFPNIRHE